MMTSTYQGSPGLLADCRGCLSVGTSQFLDEKTAAATWEVAMSGAPSKPARDSSPTEPEAGQEQASLGQALRELSQPFRDFSAAPSALPLGNQRPGAL